MSHNPIITAVVTPCSRTRVACDQRKLGATLFTENPFRLYCLLFFSLLGAWDVWQCRVQRSSAGALLLCHHKKHRVAARFFSVFRRFEDNIIKAEPPETIAGAE